MSGNQKTGLIIFGLIVIFVLPMIAFFLMQNKAMSRYSDQSQIQF